MRFEVNIEKKYFFAIMLIGLLAIGIAGVIAYNSDIGDPSVLGHSVDEMDWGSAISANVTAAGFCLGNDTYKSCIQSWGGIGTSGVSKIIAGSGISLSSQTGEVTISSGGGSGGGVAIITSGNFGFHSTNTNPLDLGVWDYCALNWVDDDTHDASCYVYKSGNHWYGKSGTDSGGDQGCSAICFNATGSGGTGGTGGTGGSLDCVTATGGRVGSQLYTTITATCPSGYTVTGGSCYLADDAPSGWACGPSGNGWTCGSNSAKCADAYARCCKIIGGGGTSEPVVGGAERYVVEATPADVGKIVPLNVAAVERLCKDADGCRLTIAMVNWSTSQPGNIASREERLFISETSNWWRVTNNDVEGKDDNGALNQWAPWDCHFGDAEHYTGAVNGRTDGAIGFGLLNVKGGDFSDAITTCRVILED